MNDYVIRAYAAGETIRAFAATSRDTVEYARQAHNLSPVVTACLGRLLTAGQMMGLTMKNAKDLTTLKVEGDGPVGSVIVTANNLGQVKGYAFEPQAMLPATPQHKLDVAGIVGKGTLTVIKDLGMKEPYSGQIELISGEIAEDLTYYYAASEQTPSSVCLGVLMNPDNTVRCAGGFLLQVMPDAEEEIIETLEKRLAELPPITSLFAEGMSPEQILDRLLGDMELQITDKTPTAFVCNCSKERVTRALLSLGKEELARLSEDGEPISVNCHFCNQNYSFTAEELIEMRNHCDVKTGLN